MRSSIRSALPAMFLLVSLPAHAELIDRGNGMIYDSVLNITWLRDANYAMTSGHSPDGLMNWSDANSWVTNLTYGGHSGWRLPRTRPVGTDWVYSFSTDGSTDYSSGIPSPHSELAYMLRVILGNSGGLVNTGPFINLHCGSGEFYPTFWSGTKYGQNPLYPSNDDARWVFGFVNNQGIQSGDYEYKRYCAWAVHDGDLAVATPFTLFSTGLDASSNPLALGSLDPHYQIAIFGNPQALVLNPPDPGYSPNTLASQWVWQKADGQPTNVTRIFRTTFDLTGFDPQTAVIQGFWATDNSGLDIKLNGNSTGIALPTSSGTNYSVLHPFSINDPAFLREGINTLEFVVEDTGGVAGFRAELTGTATAAPSFTFTGFFPPIDNAPVGNTVTAGAAVPVKFSLGGDHGLNIFAGGFPASQPVACDSFAVLAVVEEKGSAGNSGLKYDASSDQYTYVWKTERSWARTCRQLVIRFKDGSFHMASFKFWR